MIGYRVTARCPELQHEKVYDGWFEGDPTIERKAKSKLFTQAGKETIKRLGGLFIGGVAGGAVKAASVVAIPFSSTAGAIGELIAETIKKLHMDQASAYLELLSVHVNISGDCRGEYLIRDYQDLRALPVVMAVLPVYGKPEESLGESVLESTLFAQVNFISHAFSRGNWYHGTSGAKPVYELSLNIDL